MKPSRPFENAAIRMGDCEAVEDEAAVMRSYSRATLCCWSGRDTFACDTVSMI